MGHVLGSYGPTIDGFDRSFQWIIIVKSIDFIYQSDSSAAAIGGNALVGNPHPLGQLSGLPEHIDRDAAAWVPVTPDPQPFRLDLGRDPFADCDGAVLMKRSVIAET